MPKKLKWFQNPIHSDSEGEDHDDEAPPLPSRSPALAQRPPPVPPPLDNSDDDDGIDDYDQMDSVDDLKRVTNVKTGKKEPVPKGPRNDGPPLPPRSGDLQLHAPVVVPKPPLPDSHNNNRNNNKHQTNDHGSFDGPPPTLPPKNSGAPPVGRTYPLGPPPKGLPPPLPVENLSLQDRDDLPLPPRPKGGSSSNVFSPPSVPPPRPTASHPEPHAHHLPPKPALHSAPPQAPPPGRANKLPVGPSLDSFPWFHGNTDRKTAERLLIQHGGTEGSFLIRNTSDGSSFAVTFVHNDMIYHNKIDVVGGQCIYKEDGTAFPTLPALVEYYARYPDSHNTRFLRTVPRLS